MKLNPAIAALTLFGASAWIPLQLAHAQGSAFTGDEPLVPWYRTEVIVFKHLQDVPGEDEVFTPPNPVAETEFALLDTGPIDAGEDRWMESFPSQIAELNNNGAREQGQIEAEDSPVPGQEDPALDPGDGLEFRLADIQAMELIDELERLQGRSFYQVLAHLAWEQPGYGLEQSHPFPLAEYAGAQSGLDGDVTLYRGRYLHMVFDLSLQAPVSEQILVFPPRKQSLSPRYRIAEDRRMRSGELHYIDHPKFGILLKVTEVDAAPQVAPDSDTRPQQ